MASHEYLRLWVRKPGKVSRYFAIPWLCMAISKYGLMAVSRSIQHILDTVLPLGLYKCNMAASAIITFSLSAITQLL